MYQMYMGFRKNNLYKKNFYAKLKKKTILLGL